MIESAEEERLFKSCSTHKAAAYKILIGIPEGKRSFSRVSTNMWTNVELILTVNEVNLHAVLK
jgi:hypothetical protein